jgi:hypothetical protein
MKSHKSFAAVYNRMSSRKREFFGSNRGSTPLSRYRQDGGDKP